MTDAIDARLATTVRADGEVRASTEQSTADALKLLQTLQAEGDLRRRLPTRASSTSSVHLVSVSFERELPRLRTHAVPGEQEPIDLQLGVRIGEGGMGIVESAHQRALLREVAVKRTRSTEDHGAAARALVAEARILGALEHPNVVPVHALGLDERGAPLLVMKRISGHPWSAHWLSRPSADRWDELEAWIVEQLEVLMVVCNAVQFAHSRDVLHRDLKPDNVMIEEFGAIYVVDWGIALSLREHDRRGVPTLAEVDRIAGTPAYMAPEMLRPELPLCAQSDVYLLGAMLFEILTGKPPHTSRSIADALQGVTSSRRAYAPIIPRELTEVCERALAHRAVDRYPSAEALRGALADFLSHRASIAIAIDAESKLDELEQRSADLPDVVRRTLYSECRFGFEHALKTWGDNERALAGRDRALAAMLRIEVDAQNLATASQLAAEMREVPEALRDALEALANRRIVDGEEMRRLRAVARDQDADVAARPRVAIAAGVIIFWGVLPVTIAWLRYRGLYTVTPTQHAVAVPMFLGLTALVTARLGRETILQTAINRRFLFGLFVVPPMLLLNRTLVLARGWNLAEALQHDLVIVTAISAMLALSVDVRAIGAAIVFAIGAVLVGMLPADAEAIMTAACVAGCLVFILANFASRAGGPKVG